MARFETDIQVGFEHTDIAGVVFYPRYFEMLSRVVERWFQERLGCNYRQFHQVEKRGIPLVDVHCRFTAPSFLSDVLRFSLEVARLGRRSVTLHVTARCDDELRMEATMIIVHSQLRDGGMASVDIPPELAAGIGAYLRPEPAHHPDG